MQYSFFLGEVVPVKLEPHGNARHSERPYIRTQHSTLNEIKENLSTLTPKAAIKVVYDNAGGVTNAQSLSEVPRDRRQAYNAKSHDQSISGITSNQNKDLVYDLIEQHYGSLKNFVRNVSFDDSVMCVLSTDQQLNDIERFCVPQDFGNTSILGIDPTFNLGDFYVTVTTYENRILRNRKTGKHPIFIGPMLVHQRRTYETYFHFASELLKYRKELVSLNAIGTDGEDQLRSAFSMVFPSAVKLLCSLHKRDNIKTKLRSLGVPEQQSKEIMKSIFGHQIESTHYTGLIDAEDIADFEIKLEGAKQNWDSICSDFYPWFVSKEAELFTTSMICPVRSSAGLGLPPCQYTTNNNESINRVLKDKVNYKKQEWPQFNLKMYDLVKEQEEEFCKAVCGCGEYELCAEYKSMEVSNSDWVIMTPEQRKAKQDKLLRLKVQCKPTTTLSSEASSSSVKMSVDFTSAHITHLQPNRVAELWKKAETILNTPNMVVPAAGNQPARQVASSQANASNCTTPPHYVYSKKSKKGTEIHCDCPVYRSSPNVCQHSLATAEDMGILSDYLVWVRKTKATALNLSSLISKEVSKSAGKKGSTSHRKGVQKGKKKAVLSESDYNPPSSSCPSLSTEEPLSSFSPYSTNFSSPPPALSYYPTFTPPAPFSSYYNPNYPPLSTSFSASSSYQPVFKLKHLEGTRIRSCYGCGNAIRKDVSFVPPPPHDIVVSHKERRYYRDPNTQEMRLTSSDNNTHYHLMLRCITHKHPAFQMWMLEVPDDIKSTLLDVHRMHLFEQFGLHL